MKKLLIVTLALSAVSASAMDSPCVTKQKNAASFAIAQEIGVEVQGVQVVGFDPGVWTEGVGNNVGNDTVTVRAGSRTNHAVMIKAYDVGGVQIGRSDDCNIDQVVEAK